MGDMNILDTVFNSTNSHTLFQRQLQDTGEGPDNGTVAVLVIVCILFCFIWTPVMVRRCRGHPEDVDDQDLARFEAEARAVRATLERMSVLTAPPMRNEQPGALSNGGACMSLEDRREFVDNALLTKKVIFQDSDKELEHSTTSSSKDVDGVVQQQQQQQQLSSSPSSHKDEDVVMVKEKDDLIISRRIDRQTGKLANFLVYSSNGESKISEKEVEPCPICLSDYEDGEEICWAQNKQCHHVFHRDCIAQWLLTHEECPCCRQVFLMFWDDEEEQERPRLPNSTLSSSSQQQQQHTRSTTTTTRHIHADREHHLGVLLRNAVMDENHPFSLFYQLPTATSRNNATMRSNAAAGGPPVIRTRVRRHSDQRLPLTDAQRVWERVVMEMARPLADELVNLPTTTTRSRRPTTHHSQVDISRRDDVETGMMVNATTGATTTTTASMIMTTTSSPPLRGGGGVRTTTTTDTQLLDSHSEGGVTIDLDEIPLHEDDASNMAPPSLAVIDTDRNNHAAAAAAANTTRTTTTTRNHTDGGGDSVMTGESEEC